MVESFVPKYRYCLLTYVAAPKLSLGSSCQMSDICGDPNSLCIAGLCRCSAAYYQQDNRCGE